MRLASWAAATGFALLAAIPAANAAQPITIGFDISETGNIAVNGKSVLLAWQIWQQHINAHGGLLGRPVKLLYYDDQSNPALVPGIVTKLLDIDHVDLVLGEAGTIMIAPAMPIFMQRHLTMLSFFGLDVNKDFHYANYFSMIPSGGMHPAAGLAEGFFKLAAAMDPKPNTIAIAGADQDFAIHGMDGAREQAKAVGLSIVYDHTYPPTTVDYSPIVRAIQASHPDLVFVASYPADTVGIIRAVGEVGLRARMFGGAMVGLQSTAIKQQLGPLMNGIEDYDFWLPVKGFATPDAMEFLQEYQPKAAAEHIDPLGYYQPPFAYADLQVLQQAIEGTQSLDQQKIADYLRSHTFHTIVGDVKFGPNGEWAEPRTLAVQFRGVAGHDLEQFRDPKVEVVLWPSDYQTGTLQTPYDSKQ
ncbi:MAG TPA: amino acid ABC transporter substrate-binding protein [Acetobacteraceae bacterium]|nr:amino acid ABC transporter substrate-binding protein [Acetobacteraceae bacterium]